MMYSAIEVKRGSTTIRRDARGVRLLFDAENRMTSGYVKKFSTVEEFTEWVIALEEMHGAVVAASLDLPSSGSVV